MLREIQDFIASLDGEKYDHRNEDQKRYRMPDQWPHSLYHAEKDREERLGRKANVIDRIAEHLKIRDKHE